MTTAKARPPRFDANAFVSIAVNSPNIHRGLKSAQEKIVQHSPHAFGSHSTMAKLHVTLMVMNIGDDPEILVNIGNALKRAVQSLSKTLTIDICGLGQFERDQNIVFAKITSENGRLEMLARNVVKEVSKVAGVEVPSFKRPFHPHMTLFQTREHRVKEHVGFNIPPEAIFKMKSTDFGSQNVGAIQLLRINKSEEWLEHHPKLIEDIVFGDVYREEESKDKHKECCGKELQQPK